MVTKALEMSLGSIGALQTVEYSTGWYQDDVTGEYYYYDATEKKWYIYAAGYLYPMTIGEQSAPKTVTLKAGDILKISISYKYVGPAVVGAEEYFSVGIKGITYSPKIYVTATRSLPICATPTIFTSEKSLLIPVNVGEDWTAIECKVWHGTPDVPETGLRYTNALEIVGITAEITEFSIVDFVKA